MPYGIEFVSTKNNEKLLYQLIYSYEKINNGSKLSNNAKNLYTISPSVEKSKNLYEKLLNNKYNYSEIRNFFLNYNTYNNKDEIANKLYYKYKDLLGNEDKETKNNKIIIGLSIFSIVIIILLLLFFKYKKHKNSTNFTKIS